MLGKVFRGGVFRFVTWVLIAALSFPLGLPIGVQRAEAAGGGLLVAVVGLENLTGRDILPGDYGIGAIIAAATRVEGIEMIPVDRVLTLLDGEPDEETALAAAEALGADMALFGRVTELEFENERNALVTVELYLYSTGKDEALLSRSRVTGTSGEKFGYRGELSSLADEALRDAVDATVENLFGNLSDYGVITMASDQGIYTNLTLNDGVTTGSELAVIRDYEQIATLRVEESKTSHTTARVVKLKPGLQVEKGDRVRVIYRPQVTMRPADKPKVKKKKKMSPIIIGVLAVGVIVALTRGKDKASTAVQQQRTYSTRSTDGVAYIYAKNGFTADYTPKSPQKMDITATTLNTCNSIDPVDCTWDGATTSDCSTQIYVINGSTYDYSLATNPKSKTLPSGWYIAVDMTKLSSENPPGPTDSTNKVKFATCNTTTGDWELLDSSYGTNGDLKLTQAVSTPVTSFSPYVVVVDSRPDPISATTLSYTDCDANSIDLSWLQSTDSEFKEYELFQCDTSSSSTCSNSIKTISSSSTTTETRTGLITDTEYCYAVRVNSTTGLRDSNLSNVVCVTPSPTCVIDPTPGEVTLISPANAADITESSPTFVFIGTGESDKYILYVEGQTTNENDEPIMAVIFSSTVDGEGSGSESDPETYEVQYAGPNLTVDEQYTWYVIGINETTGEQKVSDPVFTFTFREGGLVADTTCNTSLIPDVPELLTPNNGAQIAVPTPTFQWQDVDYATSYTITVYNAQSWIVYQKNVQDNIDTSYDGDELKNNESYFWTVRSHTDCAASAESSSFSFTKVSTDVSPLPAPEWVDPVTDGKSPITQIDGGDQYIVRLYWRQVNDTNLAGYRVFRCTEQGACANEIAMIFKEQLSAPPPNVNCGSFSELSPGFCDISATNGMRHFYTITAFDDTQQDSEPSVPQNILLSLKRPTLISPGDVTATEITTGKPMLTWQAVPGDNVRYIVTVKNDASGLIIWEYTTSNSSEEYNSATPLVDENTYSWYVTAFNDLVTSDKSLTFKFTKKASSTKPDAPYWCDDPDATKCAAYPNYFELNYTRNSIKLYWQKVSGSDIQEYKVYRATSEGGLPGAEGGGNEIGTAQNQDCGTLADIVCYEDRGDGAGLPRGEYYYYALRTVDSGLTESLPSETRSVLNYSLLGAQLVYPANNQDVYDPQPYFSWLPELGADQYRLELKLSTDGWDERTWVKTTSDTSAQYGAGDVSPETPLATGKTYNWRVCSINENYTTGVCGGAIFNFTKQLLPPVPVSPIEMEVVTTDDITFSWTATPGAAGYKIKLYYKDGGSDIMVATPEVSGGETTSINLSQMGSDITLQNGTTYVWRIRAYDSYGAVSEWSSDENMFVKADSEAPVLLLPADNQVIGPDPECGTGVDMYGNYTYNYHIESFSWTAVSGADTYKIKVEEEIESPKLSFTTIWETTVGGTSIENINSDCQALGDTDPQPSGVILFSPGRVYRWNVSAIGNDYDDTNARFFYTGLPAPDLTQPFAGMQVIIMDDCDGLAGKICVHFEWEDVFGAARYEIEIARVVGTSKEYYRCEPGATASSFIGYTSVNTSSCNMSTAAVDNEDLFTWRVRALDGNDEPTPGGNPSPWSATWNFTVLIPAPVLSSPPNSTPDPDGCPTAAQQNGFGMLDYCTTVPCQDPSFYWSPIPLASDVCYKIQVSDTEDFRNIIFEDSNASGVYVNECTGSTAVCGDGNCCVISQALPENIPMVNGVVYYWRVGAGTTKTGSVICGESWVYSEPYLFYKQPPPVPNVSFKDLDYNTVTITWDRPVNCSGDPGTAAYSTPSVPDDPTATLAAYLIYMDTTGTFPTGCEPPDNLVGRVDASQTEWTPPAGLVQETSEYVFCVVVRDDSGVENWAGSMSCPTCVYVVTPEDPAP